MDNTIQRVDGEISASTKMCIMIDGKEYKPQEDITAFELSKIMELIFIGQYNEISKTYIEDNKLERHFV
jgi:hypothetical protein